MIRNIFIVSIFFVLYEGFYLLPEKLVVVPGVFRLSDAFFLILPIFGLLFFQRILHSLFKEEAILVLSICALMFVAVLMAWLFFGQSFETGILVFRHHLNWLSFFLFVVLLKDLDGVEKLLKLLTALVGIYVVLLLLTKYCPWLGIIQFSDKYYSKNVGGLRFGDHRLFFPYADIPIFFCCLTLARVLFPAQDDSRLLQLLRIGFILLVVYAILSTYTRILVVSMLAVTIYALFTSRRPILSLVAIGLIVGMVSIQSLSMAAGWGGVSLVEESKLGKMVMRTSNLENEAGRRAQFYMYVEHFLKSPLTGVGTLSSGKYDFAKNLPLRTFKQFGFFNAVDLGYMKMAAEYGLVGLAWIYWYYRYLYKRSRELLSWSAAGRGSPLAEAIARGHLYFLIYLLISGLTLPHFVTSNGITILALSLAILAVTHQAIKSRSEPPDSLKLQGASG